MFFIMKTTNLLKLLGHENLNTKFEMLHLTIKSKIQGYLRTRKSNRLDFCDDDNKLPLKKANLAVGSTKADSYRGLKNLLKPNKNSENKNSLRCN
jgi:hypothetical protein